jgi:hypothetical protein
VTPLATNRGAQWAIAEVMKASGIEAVRPTETVNHRSDKSRRSAGNTRLVALVNNSQGYRLLKITRKCAQNITDSAKLQHRARSVAGFTH